MWRRLLSGEFAAYCKRKLDKKDGLSKKFINSLFTLNTITKSWIVLSSPNINKRNGKAKIH